MHSYNGLFISRLRKKIDVLNVSSLGDLAYLVGTVASLGPVHHNEVYGCSVMGCPFMETFLGRLGNKNARFSIVGHDRC